MDRAVVALVCEGQPPTANKELRPDGRDFLERLRDRFKAAGWPARDGLLRGTLYWFVRGYDKHLHPDADNLSKKIWGSLEGLAFEDDKQVRLRIAAVVDLGATAGPEDAAALEQIDLSEVPEGVSAALDRLVSGPVPPGKARTPSFTYIELGPLDYGMVRFGAATVAGGRREQP